MKKIIAMILAVMMLATCLVACGSNEETAGTKIAVQKGTTSLMYAQVLKGAEAVSYDTFALAANDMKNGNAAYVFVDKTTAKALCKEITEGRCEKGILCCGTGIGMSIAANKVRGIRAAVLSDEFSAEMTRRHNNTNVLCLGGRVIDCEKAVKLADIFLNTEYEGGRHDKRVAMLED